MKQRDLRAFLEATARHNMTPTREIVGTGAMRDTQLSDSNSTLTDSTQSYDGLQSFDKNQAKLPFYCSDTRLMDFTDSNSTLNVGEDNFLASNHAYKMNPLYQSDTRLLHASQIELKSTNYFSRPPLSCSSMDGDDDDDRAYQVYTPPPGYAIERPGGRLSKRRPIDISGQIFQSPDGSYFSIESSDDDEDDDDKNVYENVMAIRASASDLAFDSNSSMTGSLIRKGTVYQNYSRETKSPGQIPGQVLVNSSCSDLEPSSRNSNISLIQFGDSNSTLSGQQLKRSKPVDGSKKGSRARRSMSNNQHLISNGSSAYGSGGSLTESQGSSIDTYL